MTTSDAPQVGDTWYRYEDQLVGSYDAFDDRVTGSSTKLQLVEYKVGRVTPKGVWLGHFFGMPNPDNVDTRGCRFVRLDAHRRHACPTKEEALQSFLARKERQLSILCKQVQRVKEAIQLAKSGEGAPAPFNFLVRKVAEVSAL